MKITGAKLYDPANNVSGSVRDIFISGATISAADTGTGSVIDAKGCIAMAGAIDMHAHIFGPSHLANLCAAPFLNGFRNPDTAAQKCLRLGITFFVEAGLTNRQALLYRDYKFDPPLDSVFLHLETDPEETTEKDVNGNILHHASWLTSKYVGQSGAERFLGTGDDPTVAANVHLPHLAGTSGYETFEGFVNALKGRRVHLSHLSHYAFREKSLAVREMAKLLDEYKNITFDASPVSFGDAYIFTADGETSHRVSDAAGTQAASHGDSPYAAVPYVYKAENYVDSLLWIAGMELLLLAGDPGRFALSIDFPSGGDFGAYPQIIACLMSREVRDAAFNQLNAQAREQSSLESITREYSLREIAILTRSAPAALCGLDNHGHLGEGAVADVVLYRESDDYEKMFKKPQAVIKNGKVVYREGERVGGQ